MKNALILETYDEILNAHMHGDCPELALVIPTKEVEQSDITEKKYEIGKYYPSKGVYAGELKKQDGFYGIFVTLKDAGEKDEDDDSREFTWDKAMKLKFSQDNLYVPDIREMSLIHLNIDYINAGLEAANGEKLQGWYWSSTEYNMNYAWTFNMDGGYRGWYGKSNSYYYFVRPVLALKL